ncbi:MAG TPA: LON peptidase substrate-binding domain-containing protein [Thermoanaerobaculia bacterium]|nr:LON peptidase substrate-binding domain-containing protein [Thermoanaerobaculia bacterium]
MSRRIPLFPLPGVVLLPGTLLPLHIFEPRYKTMVGDALAGNRTIGMAMLKPGWESRDANPAVYPVGGAGEIIESEALEDGRYNILLEGRFRYRILEEATLGPYRAASVEEIASVPFSTSGEERRINHTARKLFEVIRGELELAAIPETALSPERLASELALRLRYSPEELQTLLETDSVPARFGTLIGRMLEWHRRIRFLAPFRPPELDVTRN